MKEGETDAERGWKLREREEGEVEQAGLRATYT